MPKPNADEFARCVLWRLAGIQAEVTVTRAQLTSLEARQIGETQAQANHQQRLQMIQEATKQYYLEACKEASLPLGESPDSRL